MQGFSSLAQPIDLSGYATISSLNSSINGVNSSISTINSSISSINSSIGGLTTKVNNQKFNICKTTVPVSGWALDNIVNTAHDSMWKFRKFSTLSSPPTLSQVTAATPTSTSYRADSAMGSWYEAGDNYSGWVQTYVYVSSAKAITNTFTTDDAGALYLNDKLITTLASCQATSITLNLPAGWSKIDILYTEGSGGDGAIMSTRMASQVEKMYAEGIYGYSQTLTATTISGSDSITTGKNYVWQPFLIPNSSDYIVNNEGKKLILELSKATITVPSNGKIKVNGIIPSYSNNFDVYWLYKEV